MDANDEKLINKQIQLLQNKQLTLQHAVQNQITVKHNDRAYKKHRNHNGSKRKIITKANNELFKLKGNKRTLCSTYSSYSGSNTRRGKYNGISYISKRDLCILS